MKLARYVLKLLSVSIRCLSVYHAKFTLFVRLSTLYWLHVFINENTMFLNHILLFYIYYLQFPICTVTTYVRPLVEYPYNKFLHFIAE